MRPRRGYDKATEPDLKILREVHWEEVGSRYTCEHQGGNLSDFLDSLRRAGEKYAHNWVEVLISRKEALSVRLPAHDHRPSPMLEAGLSVCSAAETLSEPVLGNEAAACLDRIRSHRTCDFSSTMIFLEFCDDSLQHLDGLHRLLAYAIYGLTQEISAFVCGLPPSTVNSAFHNT
jgi:hypothetical protein